MTNIEDVIREAALKNHYGLKEDDPQMVLVTILNRIAEDWQRVLDAALEKYLNAHEESAHRWRKNATAQAEKILNVALAASREAMTKGMNEGTEKVFELVRGQIDAVLREALSEQKTALALATEKFRLYSRSMLWGCGAAMLLALIIAACL